MLIWVGRGQKVYSFLPSFLSEKDLDELIALIPNEKMLRYHMNGRAKACIIIIIVLS